MNGEEGPIAARAVRVNGAGDEFLPGAAFATDEYARFGRGHERDPFENALHERAFADDRIRGGINLKIRR